MTPFLQLVAQDLNAKFGSDYSRTVIVFPNKRAGLFMSEHLLQCAEGRPLWAPRYLTINEFFQSFVPDLSVNDRIDTTLRIVTLFSRLTGREVSVDWFYGWAERLLSDFDDVDKNMADAKRLFTNVADWRAFDDTSFLSAEQVEELRRFFADFSPEKKNEIRERYTQLWDVLYDLYDQLNANLAEKNLAYEGALFRHVVEHLQSGDITLDPTIDRYVIVGFNVLDRVEQELFTFLQREGRAIFYWDYDEYYTYASSHEAGTFLRENLDMFPNELSAECFRNLAQPKDIHMVSSSTEAIQAQYVGPWISKYKTPHDPKRTAVIICNENLLQPVLHCLPDDAGQINITKGFPLAHTEVATYVEQKMSEWERQKTQRPITELLASLSSLVMQHTEDFVTGRKYDDKNFADVLQSEGYYTMHTILNRFTRIMERYTADADAGGITIVTLRRLLRTVVRQATIPFHGEPVLGLQIMGVLETRCLDFDHILMLSANDGILPKKSHESSFIPYVLRKAYGLTTSERRIAVYAYYFYRLLQRSSHITMTYNISTDGTSTGEMSRFMTQLLVEWPHTVQHHVLTSPQTTIKGAPRAVDKPSDLIERLIDGKSGYPSLSPSALSVYLECPVRFYFQRVMGIRQPEEKTNEIKPNVFGSIFHTAAELVYKYILDNLDGHVTADYLNELANNANAIHSYVTKAFAENEVEYRILEAQVIELFLVNLLRADARHGNFDIVGTETKAECFVDVPLADGRSISLRLNGTVDRIDFVNTQRHPTTLRVVDYKTGNGKSTSPVKVGDELCYPEANADSIDDIFAAADDKTHKGPKAYILQTYLYYRMLLNMAKTNPRIASYIKYPVMPVLFFNRMATNPRYNPNVRIEQQFVTDFSILDADMDQRLKHLIANILDTTTQFKPTAEASVCERCPYKILCHAVEE